MTDRVDDLRSGEQPYTGWDPEAMRADLAANTDATVSDSDAEDD